MLLIVFFQSHFNASQLNASSLIHTCKYLCVSSQYYIYKLPAMNNYLQILLLLSVQTFSKSYLLLQLSNFLFIGFSLQ